MTNAKPEFPRRPCGFKCKDKTKDGYCKWIRCRVEAHLECKSCYIHPANGGSGFCNYNNGSACVAILWKGDS